MAVGVEECLGGSEGYSGKEQKEVGAFSDGSGRRNSQSNPRLLDAGEKALGRVTPQGLVGVPPPFIGNCLVCLPCPGMVLEARIQ